jgi:hypothetical protein
MGVTLNDRSGGGPRTPENHSKAVAISLPSATSRAVGSGGMTAVGMEASMARRPVEVRMPGGERMVSVRRGKESSARRLA